MKKINNATYKSKNELFLGVSGSTNCLIMGLPWFSYDGIHIQ